MSADVWATILRTVRRYPSPHNSQPIRVRPADARTVELCYDLDRGLPAEPLGIPFGFVCAGIFVELVTIAAHAEGYEVVEQLCLADMDTRPGSPEHGAEQLRGPGSRARRDRLHRLGTLTLVPAGGPVPDLDVSLIAARRTSRLPYAPGAVDPSAIAEVRAEAARWGHRLATTTDRDVVDRVVRINQRTLFDDLAHPVVRAEIAAWLRYSRAEAARTGDGLAAECLHLPGPVLRWFIARHRWWSRRVPGAIARWLYLRTMRGVSQLAWLTGPFTTNADFVDAGRAFIRAWLRLTAHGVAVHPFGSVITNPRSHADFTAVVGEDEARGMAWMLLRIGYSKAPPVSHRLPADELLVGGRA